jgi:predicted RNA binding protein YcfA (HicA-like mRNA interferase family)
MKTKRNLSGTDLIKILNKLGYETTRQNGSHVRLSRTADNTTHHLTVPKHNPLKLGTLSAIISAAAENLKISKEDILK